MSNEIISFPHLGDYYNPIKKLLESVTKMKVVPSPPITKKTIELGSKYSPDSVCVPFKYNLGNYIEALENGATILMQAGGGCRFRYYAEVQEIILKELGYKFKFIQLIGKNRLNFNELYSIFKKLNPGLKKRSFIHEILYCILYILFLDKLDSKIRKKIGFEVNKGSLEKIKKGFINKCNKSSKITTLFWLYIKYSLKISRVQTKKVKNKIKVGIIGELYTAMEPFSTYNLEKMLAKYNVEIKRFTNLTYLLWKKPLFISYMKLKCKKYAKYKLGADGLDNVYRTLWLKKHKFDGIIHTKPSGCTPEIGAIPIIMKITNDNKIPIIFLSFDEQTSNEGIKTRIEAFYDLMSAKKEDK